MNPAWAAAYAADFVSYLLQKLSPRDLASIELIALYGSAARGETTPDSDVDLFVQVTKPTGLRHKITALINDFEASMRVLDYWKPLGVRLPLSVKVGRPSNWAALPDALAEHGKVLYGPYRPPASSRAGERGVIFAWENIESSRVRTNIYRNLFGYESHGKRYHGLVVLFGGRRLTKGAVWIPLAHFRAVEQLFRKNRVTCRMLRVAADEAPSSPPLRASR